MNPEPQNPKADSPRSSVLVTGGAGFIGSELVRQLLDQGEDPGCKGTLLG